MVSSMSEPFKFPDMPSAEHRGHIRRFQRLTLTDEQDVAIRGFDRLEAVEPPPYGHGSSRRERHCCGLIEASYQCT